MKNYDEKAPSKHIMYLDANNMYGWAIESLITKWRLQIVNGKLINNIDLATYKEDSKKGMILEVDIEYPQKLHNCHNDSP